MREGERKVCKRLSERQELPRGSRRYLRERGRRSLQ
jgi:hypothetical protein